MIKYHENIIQGTDEWFALRCGLLTASEMKYIITPAKLQYAAGEKEKTHLYDLASQNITKYVEPTFKSFHMRRGEFEEQAAKLAYEEKYERVLDMGFITNDKWGFTLGYSPDGLIGDIGQIECKSRMPKYHMETVVANAMPDEFLIQVQTGLAVSERPWCDFISYCGGMHMFTLRVEADIKVQGKIIEAATVFHEKLDKVIIKYKEMITCDMHRLIPTEREYFEDIDV